MNTKNGLRGIKAFFMFIKFHFSFKLIMGCYELEKLDIFTDKLFLAISLRNLDYHLF